MSTCPNCGCSFTAAKSKNAGEKMLAEDRAKAWRAIEALDRLLLAAAEPPHMLEAMDLEQQRLVQALDAPEKLWAIYRRNEKKQSYAVAPALAIAA